MIDDCRQLIRLAVREDFDRGHDLTSCALVPREAQGNAAIMARQAGVVCGLQAAQLVLEEMDIAAQWRGCAVDGQAVAANTMLAELSGAARDLLAAERILLNFLGRLSGVATLASRFVEAVRGTSARVYDTRKTTPGWRRLEKYAVRCGGGHNHRTGLFDAILIKDNHLAFGAAANGNERFTVAQAVERAQEFLHTLPAGGPVRTGIVEVEVDTLDQLQAVLPSGPHIVLLDNMSLAQLREAVAARNRLAPQVELEASGGVRLDTIRSIAETGVDRISCGSLTHSAIALDVALDWR